MDIYLGLGSNLGERRENLRAAIAELDRRGVHVGRVSPVVESPALLPEGAKPAWNLPFLNLALRATTAHGPAELLRHCKEIEADLGRESDERWAPRTIDIDILLYGDEIVHSRRLDIPHPALTQRSFVLTTLVALNPGLRIPGLGAPSVFELTRASSHPIPLWMGIVNVTPDSFSDGGRWQRWEQVAPHVEEMVDAGAQIIDLGAESTRPGASAIGADDEWLRLAPLLARLVEKYRDDVLRPRISIDTYHPEVARRALDAGADIINDVSGLTNPAMIELAASYDAEWVAMHQLGLPADPRKTLPAQRDPVDAVNDWLESQLNNWARAGVDINRVYADPGIGFGKNSLQSLQLLKHCGSFRRHGLRTVIGHSRKSFMGSFAPADNWTRDLTTVGASLNVVAQGADVIRVHNVPAHVVAYRGWAHLNR
jgi:2-amino-4-hydroxy-6-hydroxymethyldihydropteridine diphosphokinase/dihydropteroate synthase